MKKRLLIFLVALVAVGVTGAFVVGYHLHQDKEPIVAVRTKPAESVADDRARLPASFPWAVGVPLGMATLAGFIYLFRRQCKT